MSEPLIVESGSITIHRAETPRVLSSIFLAIYAIAGVLGLVGAFVAEMEAVVIIGWLSSFFVWPLMFLSYVLSLSPTWATGTIEVRLVEVIVTPARGEARRIGRSDILGALVVNRLAGDDVVVSYVDIELRSGERISSAMKDEATARTVVERLGFGPGGARVEASVALPSRRLVHPVLGVASWLIGFAVTVGLVSVVGTSRAMEMFLYGGIWPIVNLLTYLTLRRAARPPRVVVGEDGVFVEWGLLERRFLRRSSSGEPTDLPLDGVLLDRQRCRALSELAAARNVVTAASDEAMSTFARDGRTLAAWREELGTKMDRGGYRHAASSVETASAVLRSPRATAEQRVGAAVALRVAGEPPEKIRVAADAVADEGLRGALLAVAEDGDDETLERRLRTIGRADDRR